MDAEPDRPLKINYFSQIQAIISELFLLQENPESGEQECQQLILKLKEEMNTSLRFVDHLPRIDLDLFKLEKEQLLLQEQLLKLKYFIRNREKQSRILELDIFRPFNAN